MTAKQKITVEVIVNQTMDKVWKLWTTPADITKWNYASDDWHTPKAENDLRVGGKFLSRMEAKDGSFGFDFCGTYTSVLPNKEIGYTMEDGRTCVNTFSKVGDAVKITTVFEAETENTIELQQGGWQAISNNFKKYAETNG